MSFLWPLGFAFAGALAVVIAFYLLKRKRVVHVISSTLLWQRFLAETQANSPFQRLRHNWLLLLQLLLLALAVLALAQPYMSGDARATRLRILVLDSSASMQSTDVSPNRFEQARAQALRWIDGLRSDEQIMILEAGATTEVKQSPTRDKIALRRALQSCAPSDGPTRLADALKTASAFTFEKRGEENVTTGEIHLFSDGAASDLDTLANLNLPLIYHQIGQGGSNIGLVAVDVKPHPEQPGRRALFAAVANPSTNTLVSDIELRFEDQLLETRTLTLPPQQTQPLVFIAPQDRDGIFTLRLLLEDDLAADNHAAIVSTLPQNVKVLLVTRGNAFLGKALRAVPNLTLKTTDRLLDDARGSDVVVFDDVLPIVWPALNTLALRAAPTNWFEISGTVQGPPIVDWKSAHPVLRFVDLDNVQIAKALAIQPPAWGAALVESPETPLIVAGDIDQRRVLWLGFDPLESTWPLRVSFPIFIANAIDWLNPSAIQASQLLVRAGDPLHLQLLEHQPEVRITPPQGAARTLSLAAGAREVVFGDTAHRGVYRLQAGTNEMRFCVNLLDANESNIQPHPTLPLGKYESVAAAQARKAGLPLWRWFLLGAVLFLLFEWWFYHKRTA